MFNYEKLREDFSKYMIINALTNKGMTRILGMEPSYITDFMNKEKNFPIHRITKACSILNLDVKKYMED